MTTSYNLTCTRVTANVAYFSNETVSIVISGPQPEVEKYEQGKNYIFGMESVQPTTEDKQWPNA
jgi:hypothetical protein